MPKFNDRSLQRLQECDKDLQIIFEEVIKNYDCTILCGHRGKEDQDEAVRTGKSKLSFPNSKHNSTPSRAIDVVPYPIDWNDKARFYHFAGYVCSLANSLGIKIRWGGDWNGDLNFKNDSFVDMPHFQLEE
jgi:hypothetical protein